MEITENTGLHGETEPRRRTEKTAVRRVGRHSRPTGAGGSDRENEHTCDWKVCSFFRSDPSAQRRFATPVEPQRDAIFSVLLRVFVPPCETVPSDRSVAGARTP